MERHAAGAAQDEHTNNAQHTGNDIIDSMERTNIMRTYTIQQVAVKIADRLEDRDAVGKVSDHGLLIVAHPDQICTRSENAAIKASVRRWAKQLGYAVRVSQPRSRHGENQPIYVRVVDAS